MSYRLTAEDHAAWEKAFQDPPEPLSDADWLAAMLKRERDAVRRTEVERLWFLRIINALDYNVDKIPADKEDIKEWAQNVRLFV